MGVTYTEEQLQIALIEQALGQVNTDSTHVFRILDRIENLIFLTFGLAITGFLGLGIMMVYGFHMIK